jgi:hypothetical protein
MTLEKGKTKLKALEGFFPFFPSTTKITKERTQKNQILHKHLRKTSEESETVFPIPHRRPWPL